MAANDRGRRIEPGERSEPGGSVAGARDGRGERDAGMEWAKVAPSMILVATASRAWIHRPGDVGDHTFLAPMQGPGSPATTRNLLDAAVGAAQREAEKAHAALKAKPAAPPMTPLRWVWRLAGYYTTTHATPPLMLEAARRFAERGLPTLAAWAEEKAVEERGHDELALRDIRALGYDAEAVVAKLKPETAASLVRYFTASVRAEDPVGCVGYSYALERLALTRDKGYIERIQRVLPPGVDATRCLRVHSGAGTDARHVEETIQMAADLSAPLRAQIALATYETTALCYLPAAKDFIDFIGDNALRNLLAGCESDAALTRVNSNEQN